MHADFDERHHVCTDAVFTSKFRYSDLCTGLGIDDPGRPHTGNEDVTGLLMASTDSPKSQMIVGSLPFVGEVVAANARNRGTELGGGGGNGAAIFGRVIGSPPLSAEHPHSAHSCFQILSHQGFSSRFVHIYCACIDILVLPYRTTHFECGYLHMNARQMRLVVDREWSKSRWTCSMPIVRCLHLLSINPISSASRQLHHKWTRCGMGCQWKQQPSRRMPSHWRPRTSGKLLRPAHHLLWSVFFCIPK